MTSIDSSWLPPGARKKENLNPDLDLLLGKVADLLRDRENNKTKFKKALIDLISFLCTEEGRTNENIDATDMYFCLHRDYGFDWDHLPESFQLILGDIGGQLHDAIEAPRIAENFESTPEQLLERLKKLNDYY